MSLIFNENSPVLQGAVGYIKDINPFFPGYNPYQFTSPRDEILAARNSAWLGTYLCMMGRMDISGPGVIDFLNRTCVNKDFGQAKIGGSRHALICDENGNISDSGIIMRIAEDKFKTYNIFSFLIYMQQGVEGVTFEPLNEFFYQVDGPKSLQIIEKAFQCDFHDLKFAQNKLITVNGEEVFVHRIGMTGALAYEMHGRPEAADMVYELLVKAGDEFGMRRLGDRQYGCGGIHTPGGYPNQVMHFSAPALIQMGVALAGSAAENDDNYYMNPFDLKWDYLINWDHEFPGKAALLKIKNENHRTAVTLVWNLEDVGKVFAAYISDEDFSREGIHEYNEFMPEFKRTWVDLVLINGKQVGVTSGRCIDYYAHEFISLGFIDERVATEGTDVEVLWGEPGKRQITIRAKVMPMPHYNSEWRNETCDVNKLVPTFKG